MKLYHGTDWIAHSTMCGDLTELQSHDPAIWCVDVQQGSIQMQILVKLFRKKQFADQTIFDHRNDGFKGFFIELLLNLMFFSVFDFVKGIFQSSNYFITLQRFGQITADADVGSFAFEICLTGIRNHQKQAFIVKRMEKTPCRPAI